MATKKKTEKIVYINYFDAIDSEKVQILMNTCIQIIAQTKPDTLYFLFASPGGQVDAGITLYNFLKSLPQKVVMHNMGSVNSIGTVVFLAGDERYAAPNTSFLFHGVDAQFPAGAPISLSKVNEIRNRLMEDQKKIAGIIAKNSSISSAEISKLFAQGETKSTEFAQQKGFIHAVNNIAIDKRDTIFNISFPQKKNLNKK